MEAVRPRLFTYTTFQTDHFHSPRRHRSDDTQPKERDSSYVFPPHAAFLPLHFPWTPLISKTNPETDLTSTGNLKISKVEKAYGDAITIQTTTNVWVDHCDLSATRDGSVDKDFYDGLTDLSHAADFVTVSFTYYHDHVSASCLVGGGNWRVVGRW